MLVTEDGIELYTFNEGSGTTPVIFIHGGPGLPPTELPVTLKVLSDKLKFYVYHQRGCGKSTRPITEFENKDGR